MCNPVQGLPQLGLDGAHVVRRGPVAAARGDGAGGARDRDGLVGDGFEVSLGGSAGRRERAARVL